MKTILKISSQGYSAHLQLSESCLPRFMNTIITRLKKIAKTSNRIRELK